MMFCSRRQGQLCAGHHIAVHQLKHNNKPSFQSRVHQCVRNEPSSLSKIAKEYDLCLRPRYSGRAKLQLGIEGTRYTVSQYNLFTSVRWCTVLLLQARASMTFVPKTNKPSLSSTHKMLICLSNYHLVSLNCGLCLCIVFVYLVL